MEPAGALKRVPNSKIEPEIEKRIELELKMESEIKSQVVPLFELMISTKGFRVKINCWEMVRINRVMLF